MDPTPTNADNPSPVARPRGPARPDVTGHLLRASSPSHWFQLACLLCAVPVFVARFPPMVDLPQHAAQIAALREMLSGHWAFQSLFDLRWLTPYWFGYLAVFVLSPLVGIVLATKLVVAVAVCALPAAAARLRQASGGDPHWDWLFLPLPFGFAYEWGFLNFIVAAPLGLLFLARVVRCGPAMTRRDAVALALWANALFFLHVLVLVFFGTVAGLMLLARAGTRRARLVRVLPLVSVLPVVLVWLVYAILHPQDAQRKMPLVSFEMWGLGWRRLAEFLPALISQSPSAPAFALPAVVALLLPWALGARLSAWSRRLPFAFYLLWMLLGPDYLLRNSFTYNRFNMVGLPLYLLAIETAPGLGLGALRRRLCPVLVAVLPLGLLLLQVVRTVAFQRDEVRGFDEILAKMAPGKRALTFAELPYSRYFDAPVFAHFPSWYQATKAGLVDYSFSNFAVVPVRYKPGVHPFTGRSFSKAPREVRRKLLLDKEYDYFVVRAPDDRKRSLFGEDACLVELAASANQWWLYRRVDDVSACPRSPRVD
jgi:hypothetical protein